ncbi:MAG: ATP-dependent DNA helicase RecQ [Saprospiraceae bacterium]
MSTPLEILVHYWKYPAFRPMQAEIVQSVLDGKDTLSLLPTGGGKSICFQVPALAREGVCLVISPLIALMKDQVSQLRKRGIVAEAIYSGMAKRDIDRVLDNCVYGNTKLLYLSPERLLSDLAKARIAKMPISMIAVDEAHCISQWGYDFRPPYLRIAEIRELHPDKPVIALTATATPEVVRDIQEHLGFRRGHEFFQQSFERKNLAYVVRHVEAKEPQLLHILSKVPGSSVVYARSRRGTKEVALLLQRSGIKADFYHAGLEPDQRDARQEAWISGKLRVIVATNAFGMGIDKPDVRTVIHLEPPDSPEAYFQEAGRAGRDGLDAYAILLTHPRDAVKLQRNFERAFPPVETIRRVYRALGSYLQLAVGSGRDESYEFEIAPFSKTYRLEPVETYYCLRALEQDGYLALSEAVYTPATLQVIGTKDELYDYQLRHRDLDLILKAILRQYQGAFTGHIRLKEGNLANFLKISRDKLRAALQQLHADKIIDYRPATDLPQVTFLRERIDADNLDLDRKLYRFRRERAEHRLQVMVRYTSSEECRSRQLLAYFGEPDAPPCGRCDACLDRKKGSLGQTEFDDLRELLLRKLSEQDGQTTQQLTADMTDEGVTGSALSTLQHLVAEGVLRFEGEQLFRR